MKTSKLKNLTILKRFSVCQGTLSRLGIQPLKGGNANRTNQQPIEAREYKKGSVTFPYVGPVTDAVARNIRQAGVAVHIRPYNTMRGRLVHPKDKLALLDQSGGVYQISCNNCPSTYVG